MWPPQLLAIYMRKGHRIYVADLALKTKFSPIAACDALRAEDWEKAKASRTSFDQLARYNKCWEERGKDNPGIHAATRQAQAFIDDLARRTAE